MKRLLFLPFILLASIAYGQDVPTIKSLKPGESATANIQVPQEYFEYAFSCFAKIETNGIYWRVHFREACLVDDEHRQKEGYSWFYNFEDAKEFYDIEMSRFQIQKNKDKEPYWEVDPKTGKRK